MIGNRVRELHSRVEGGESRVRFTIDSEGAVMLTFTLDTAPIYLSLDHVLSTGEARELAGWILEHTEGME